MGRPKKNQETVSPKSTEPVSVKTIDFAILEETVETNEVSFEEVDKTVETVIEEPAVSSSEEPVLDIETVVNENEIEFEEVTVPVCECDECTETVCECDDHIDMHQYPKHPEPDSFYMMNVSMKPF